MTLEISGNESFTLAPDIDDPLDRENVICPLSKVSATALSDFELTFIIPLIRSAGMINSTSATDF